MQCEDVAISPTKELQFDMLWSTRFNKTLLTKTYKKYLIYLTAAQ